MHDNKNIKRHQLVRMTWRTSEFCHQTGEGDFYGLICHSLCRIKAFSLSVYALYSESNSRK